MAHGTDPAFPLYASDFLTDSRLWQIDPADGFSLVRLWAFLWKEGPQPLETIVAAAGLLRCDAATAARLAREWTEADSTGRRLSPRLEAEREERVALREKRIAAGRKGGRSKGRPSPPPDQSPSSAQANAKQSASKREAPCFDSASSNGEARLKPSASASASVHGRRGLPVVVPPTQGQEPGGRSGANLVPYAVQEPGRVADPPDPPAPSEGGDEVQACEEGREGTATAPSPRKVPIHLRARGRRTGSALEFLDGRRRMDQDQQTETTTTGDQP